MPPLTLIEFSRLGGKARARKISSARLSEIARKAAKARWEKDKASNRQKASTE